MRNATQPPLILPDELVDVGRAFADMLDVGMFGMGDLANEYIVEERARHPVGAILLKLADAWGTTYDALRDYCRLARAISSDTRATVPLGYSQFRACLGAGADWRAVAEWAVSSADDFGGQPAPVRAIEAHVRDMHGGQAQAWQAHIARGIGILDRYAGDMPAEGRALWEAFADWWEEQEQ